MPVMSIVFVAAVFVAFTVFALAVAWGEYQTRLADRERAKLKGK